MYRIIDKGEGEHVTDCMFVTQCVGTRVSVLDACQCTIATLIKRSHLVRQIELTMRYEKFPQSPLFRVHLLFRRACVRWRAWSRIFAPGYVCVTVCANVFAYVLTYIHVCLCHVRFSMDGVPLFFCCRSVCRLLPLIVLINPACPWWYRELACVCARVCGWVHVSMSMRMAEWMCNVQTQCMCVASWMSLKLHNVQTWRTDFALLEIILVVLLALEAFRLPTRGWVITPHKHPPPFANTRIMTLMSTDMHKSIYAVESSSPRRRFSLLACFGSTFLRQTSWFFHWRRFLPDQKIRKCAHDTQTCGYCVGACVCVRPCVLSTSCNVILTPSLSSSPPCVDTMGQLFCMHTRIVPRPFLGVLGAQTLRYRTYVQPPMLTKSKVDSSPHSHYPQLSLSLTFNSSPHSDAVVRAVYTPWSDGFLRRFLDGNRDCLGASGIDCALVMAVNTSIDTLTDMQTQTCPCGQTYTYKYSRMSDIRLRSTQWANPMVLVS